MKVREWFGSYHDNINLIKFHIKLDVHVKGKEKSRTILLFLP